MDKSAEEALVLTKKLLEVLTGREDSREKWKIAQDIAMALLGCADREIARHNTIGQQALAEKYHCGADRYKRPPPCR